jgi:hypothetical protein
MGIRDDELNRLIRYAQGLGVSVRFKPYKPRSNVAAEWIADGSEITVYVTSRSSKTEKILSLIHELAHMKSFINNDRELEPELEKALLNEEPKKRERHRIYMSEVRDSKYWEDIYKDTNCRFNVNKLHAHREFEIWQYEMFYENSKLPSKKEGKKKWKEIKNKYKI